MGVKYFNKFLAQNKIFPTKTSYSKYSGKTIGIDMSNIIHRAIGSFKTPLTTKNKKVTTHIFGIFNKLHTMMMEKINIIAVFDGPPPEIKSKEESEQKISDEEIQDIKKLLTLLGIPFIQSIGEADTQLAYLSKKKIIDAVYSNDTDMLIFGCDTLILSLTKTIGLEYKKKNILRKLNITQLQLINIANILGNDYFPGVKGIGIKSVLEHKNDNVKSAIDSMKYYLLLHPEIFLIKKISKRKRVQYSALTEYLIKLDFNESRVKKKINRLKQV